MVKKGADVTILQKTMSSAKKYMLLMNISYSEINGIQRKRFTVRRGDTDKHVSR